MNSSPKIGSVGELQFTVQPKHTIDFAGNGMPEVLCTPWLIWYLEHAAREAMLPLIDANESTVGTHVDVQHLAATPVGDNVECRARVIGTDGTLISFQLEANDSHELIARGLHKLRVISVDRFAARLAKKSVS